jgi:hypothetical protein
LRSKNKTIQRTNETKVVFFEEIYKFNKVIANMTKWRREKTKINKIRDEKRDITTNTHKIKESLKYFENFYSNKLENLDEMD